MEERYLHELAIIKERNRKVEIDKARETSTCRKVIIAILTYFMMVLVFYFLNTQQSIFISAIVPTLGFLLSTLSMSFLKTIWIKHHKI